MASSARQSDAREYTLKNRKHAGGPVSILQAAPKSSKRSRGLKPSSPPPSTSRVRRIVSAGVILEPRRLQKILNPSKPRIPRAESILTARYASLAGVPAKTNPRAIGRNMHGMDSGNR